MNLSLLVFLAMVAHAQTFDGSGPVVPPLRADPADPLLGFGAAPAETASITVLGEAAVDPLVYELVDGEQLVVDPVLGSLFGANLSGRASLGRRVDLGLSLPVWVATDGIATGTAVGDAHLWVPVRLLDRSSWRVAVVPFVRAPTGPDARFLGDPPGAGVLGSVGWSTGPFLAHADLGFDAGVPSEAGDWPGSVRARFALDGGLRLGESAAAHVELRGRSPLGVSVPSVPTEALLSVRGRVVEQVSLSLGGGRALTQGVGAGSLRLFMGATFAFGDADEVEERFTAPEREIREVNVIDASRLPVRGATVVAGGSEVLTDHEGFADLPIKAVKEGELTVSAPGYLPTTLAISVDDPYWEVQLQRAPVALAVSAVGPDGAAAAAEITVVGPAEVGEGSVDEAGVENWELSPGSWIVAIEAEGFGRQERTVLIDETRVDPIRVDAILTPEVSAGTELDVRVVDALGRPVEDAVVAVENRDLGTTGSGGDLRVQGLSAGEHAIVVRSTQYGEAVVQEVQIDPSGTSVVTVPLTWQPGSVLVRVEGPDGKPTDATVAFSGPDALPERTVGPDGEELFVLRPGEWEVSVESTTLAPQTRQIVVDGAEGRLVTLELGLLPEEDGDAALDLTVLDPDGWPVEGLDVQLDTIPAGKTGPDGKVQLRELQRGVRFVQVQGGLVVPRLTEVDLVADHERADVVVWWVDGVVDLTATAQEDGRPLDATVTPTGPIPYPAFQLGLDGFERRVFPEGEWSFQVAAADKETLTRTVQVGSGTHRRQRVAVQLAPPAPVVGTLSVTVLDPSGAAPEVASLRLAGVDAGDVIGGRYVLDGVPVGPLEIEVDGPGLAPLVQTVQVEETTDVTLQASWAPGAVKVTTVGPEGPIDARLVVSGPEERPPIELTGGSRLVELVPGAWTLSASYEGLATTSTQVQLPATAQLTEVRIELGAERPVVLLGLVSPDEAPVVGADVRVDGASIGTTDSEGTLVFDAPPGEVMAVEVVPADTSLRPIEVSLSGTDEGEQRHEVVVPYAPREVAVAVVDAEGGAVEAATVTAYGEGDVVAEVAQGEGSLELAPGTWTVTGRSASGEVGTTRVVVPADRASEARVEVQVAAVQAATDGDVLRPQAPILFDLDSDILRDDALAVIDDLARWLQADRSAALVEVAGHTDDQGGVVYNQQLSERRAVAVRRELARRGVAPERMVARGYGLSRPATSGTDDESRQLNRRVELSVLRQSD